MSFEPILEKDRRLSRAVVDSVNEWDREYESTDDTFHGILEKYRHARSMRYAFIILAAVLVFVFCGYAVSVGPYDIGFREAYEIIWNHLNGIIPEDETTKYYVVWDLRLPRILIGLFGGAGLAVAGAVMQSILKNPLADSYTTGVSSGAGFGATVAMTVTVMAASTSEIVLSAFVFSLVPMFIIILVSRFSNTSPTTMIMAGIGTMYIFNAMTTVMMLWADPKAMAEIYSWQVGSLSNGGVSWDSVPIVVALTMVCMVFMQFMAGKLNVMATGDEPAKALGIDVGRMRLVFLAVSGLLAASVVSFVGLVGFVGLVTPHICRMFVGSDNRYLIPASAIVGAALMVGADLIGRVVLETPLPVGVIMAFIGGPLFIWLILRRSNSVW